MWLHSYTAPIVVLLALCAAGLGLVEFNHKIEPTVNEPAPGKSSEFDEQIADNSKKSATQDKTVATGIEQWQRRLGAELEQAEKRQETERKQFEDLRRSLVTDVLSKEENLRRLEQRSAAERDRDTRAAAVLEDEQINLEKAHRTLDPTGQFGKDHSEVRKLDMSMQQIRAQLAERAAQYNAREEKASAELIEIRLNLETAKQKLRYEDDRWSRRSASLETSIAQVRRSQEMLLLRRELPDMDRLLRTEADDARASRIEDKLDRLSRELGELMQQLVKP